VAAARRIRSLLGAYEEKRDLIALGAYAKGSEPGVDQAIAAVPEIERYLQQDSQTLAAFEQSVADLAKLADRHRAR
jgi:flagellar biosynthesis/type III secretory pathway ATPase